MPLTALRYFVCQTDRSIDSSRELSKDMRVEKVFVGIYSVFSPLIFKINSCRKNIGSLSYIVGLLTSYFSHLEYAIVKGFFDTKLELWKELIFQINYMN